MSGIEVAGLILGAFPVALEALDRYREVATRAGLFYQIKLKHRQCRNRLERERLVFTGNLKQLLLPIVADDEKIAEMLSNPGGVSWKDKATSDLLKARLKDSHDVYMDCMGHLDYVMKELISELALDSDTVQKSLRNPRLSTAKERLNNIMTKTGIEYQAYKIKFSNGETARNKLFKELDDWNKGLEQLLGISDKEAQLIQDRQANAVTSAIDSAICNFWINANKLFEALAAAWRCSCPGQHSTRLLLEHRDTKISEFNLLFAKPEGSQWRLQETKISEDGDLASPPVKSKGKNVAFPATGFHQPSHLTKAPRKSAMKSSNPRANKVSHQNPKTFDSVTLEQILQGQVSKPPNRRQRLALSFILSSSFLQLLNTPWLTISWAKSDIIFMKSPKEPATYMLDRPHLDRNLAVKDGQSQSDEDITKSLRQLGIVLLELCFGKLLEDQPCRKGLPHIDDDKVKFALDVTAALDWLQDVEGEAGPDYASAVKWCLVATRPSRWRQEMLRKVVKPLEGCHQCLISQSPF
ncbi:hypothetical protein SLS62_000475 [Diatrype stigma]|uniref:DUF7580 domain-containing protein n=1 Tax=Diatrype stigma TaxID=117547 RepID=A0AAN9YXI8_9PEZI